jgi:two-component system, OmpR family, response regulator
MLRSVAVVPSPNRRFVVRALVLEDGRMPACVVARVLSEEGFAVDGCARGVDAVAQAQGIRYDLIVLDGGVPDTDGPTACREVRRAGATAPILMLTARGEIRDCVRALEAGADDCMVKPFDVDEFMARVRALLRRGVGPAPLRCGDLEIDRVTRQAKLAGVALRLTNREYALLLHLLARADRIAGRSELVAHIWGTGFDPGSNLVEVLVSRLRDKFADRAWMVETVRGVGYRLRRQRAA